MSDESSKRPEGGFTGLADRWLDGLLGKGVRTVVVPAMLVALLNYELRGSQQTPPNFYQEIGALETSVNDLKAGFERFALAVTSHNEKVDGELNQFHIQIGNIEGKITAFETSSQPVLNSYPKRPSGQ